MPRFVPHRIQPPARPGMTPELHNFFRQLLHQAINSGIQSAFRKLPLVWVLLLVAVLIGVAVYFKLY